MSSEGDSWKDFSPETEVANNNNNSDGRSITSENRNGSINLTLFGSENNSETRRRGRKGGGRRSAKFHRDVFTPSYSYAPSPSFPPTFSTTTSPSSLIASKIQSERKSITAQLTLRFDGITSTSSDSRSIKVYQEIDRGSHSMLVFSGKQVKPKQHFSFKVIRKAKKPFSLSVFVDDVRDLRISTCCEYKHVPGVRLGHFTIVNVTGGGMECEYCTGSISWKEFWRNRRKKFQEPLPSPLRGTPSPVNTIQDDDRRSESSSPVLSEVDYQEELEEYNKEAFEEDDSLLEEVPNEGEEKEVDNSNEGYTLTKRGSMEEEGKINEMEKNGKTGSVESLRNGSFHKDGREENIDRSEHFQVEEEDIEEGLLPPSSSSEGIEIVEEVVVSVVDENTSTEEGTKSSYELGMIGNDSGGEGDGKVKRDRNNDINNKKKNKIGSSCKEEEKQLKQQDLEEGATSNDISFTSEVETLEIL